MHNYIKSDSETALMENRKLLERMYEVADGPRIQMWQALTTTDKLPESDIVSGLVSVSLGEKKSFSAKGMDAIKPFSNGGLRNNDLTLAGFALSYLIITVVPGDFSLGR